MDESKREDSMPDSLSLSQFGTKHPQPRNVKEGGMAGFPMEEIGTYPITPDINERWGRSMEFIRESIEHVAFAAERKREAEAIHAEFWRELQLIAERDYGAGRHYQMTLDWKKNVIRVSRMKTGTAALVELMKRTDDGDTLDCT